MVSGLWAALIAASAAILGAVASGLMMLWNNKISIKSQERRLLQDLAVKTGIEDFKMAGDMAKNLAKARHTRVGFASLGLYVLSAWEILELMSKPSLPEEEKRKRLIELSKRSFERDRALEEAEEQEQPKEAKTQ